MTVQPVAIRAHATALASERPSRHSALQAVPWPPPFMTLAGSPRNAKSTKRAHRSKPRSQYEALAGLWVKLLHGLWGSISRPTSVPSLDCTPFHYHVGLHGR